MYFSAARLAVPRHVRAARSSSLHPRAIQDALRQVAEEDSAGFTVAACPGDCLNPKGWLSKPLEPLGATLSSKVFLGAWLLGSCHSRGSSDGSRSSLHRGTLRQALTNCVYVYDETCVACSQLPAALPPLRPSSNRL